MRLHSDENIHCASQWSSLVRFLMLLNWVLPSSVVKKNPTGTCLFGQFRKMNPWLSWALLLADQKHICIFIAPAEFSELTNMKHFYHLSFSIWNCKLMSTLNTLVQQVQQTTIPNQAHWISSCHLWACSNAFLSSLELDSAQALLPRTPCALGRGKHQSHRQWVGLLPALSLQSKKNRIN